MPTPYAFTLEWPQALPEALQALRHALAAEQMGIVSEVDVQAALATQWPAQSHPQKLLGLCSPQIAQALLNAEPDIAALLPCGCGLTETPPGRTRIALQDPRVIAALSGSAEVRAACERASAALRRVAARLGEQATMHADPLFTHPAAKPARPLP